MKPLVEGRTVALLIAAIVPPTFVLSGRSLAATLLALASLITIAAGLAILERTLHETGEFASVSVTAGPPTWRQRYVTGLPSGSDP